MTQGDLAESISALAEELLGHQIAPRENFFEAGFTSLTLVQLHEAITGRLGVDLPATALFNHPNLQALERFLREPAEQGHAAATGRVRRTGGSRREVRARLRRDPGTS